VSDLDLSAPEVQAAITAAVEKATAPLIAKRDELLGEVKKLRKNAEIDPADLERVEAERDELKQQLAEANKTAKQAAKDAEAAAKRAEAAEGGMTKLLVDNGLSEALAKAGVTNPVHQKAAKALLRDQVGVVAEGGQRTVKVGDKALTDFITEWASSDEGKHFVTAHETTGGGSQGGRRDTHQQAGNLSGSREERTAAIAARFPELPK
jgi:alanyl-tRNA synthetase